MNRILSEFNAANVEFIKISTPNMSISKTLTNLSSWWSVVRLLFHSFNLSTTASLNLMPPYKYWRSLFACRNQSKQLKSIME